MRRTELQRIIFEVGRRFDQNDFFIIGSAAILAVIPEPPEGALTATRDVDVIPRGDEDAIANQISKVIGEASDFDTEHGFYAEGVTSETPTYAPRDWKLRAIPVRVDQYTAWCMEPHDLVISKLGAHREKDIEFARAVVDLGLVEHDTLQARLPEVECTDEMRAAIAQQLAKLTRLSRR